MNREKFKAATPFLIFGVLVLALLVGLHRLPVRAPGTPVLHVGDSAPVTDLPGLDSGGARFTTKAWRGRPYIINFFASWCSDCRAEHEELMTLAAASIPLVGVAFQDRPDKVIAYLNHAGNPYALVAQDNRGRASIDWRLAGVPETFVVDAQGVIRWHHVGVLTDRAVTNDLMPAWEASR